MNNLERLIQIFGNAETINENSYWWVVRAGQSEFNICYIVDANTVLIGKNFYYDTSLVTLITPLNRVCVDDFLKEKIPENLKENIIFNLDLFGI